METGVLAEMIAAMAGWLSRQGLSPASLRSGWPVLQLVLALAALAVAFQIARLVEPRLEKHIRRIHGYPELLRILVVFLRRLRWLILALLLWLEVAIMREITWPSRSHLLAILADLATAWALIGIAARLVRNRLAASVLAIVAWTAFALHILGLLEGLMALLDRPGIEFEDFRLTPLVVLKALGAVSVLIWLALTLSAFIDRRTRGLSDISPSLKVLIGKLSRAGLITAAILVGLSMVGFDLTVLAVFSGAVGLGIGFGLQKVVSNLISGVILLADKSIKPGDVITVGDTYGRINELAARYASVISRDGKEYLIPNEDLITSQVINWSYSSDLVRLDVDFGVSYHDDPHAVRELAKGAARGHPRVLREPAPVCHITGFGDSSVDYKLRFWIRDPGSGTVNVRGDVLLALWDALKEAGMEIPFPRRDLAFRSPVEVLLRRKAGAAVERGTASGEGD